MLVALQEVVALIAYEKPEESPLKDLMSMGQRERVADALNAAILQANTTPAAAAASGDGEEGTTSPMEEDTEQAPVKVRPLGKRVRDRGPQGPGIVLWEVKHDGQMRSCKCTELALLA